MPAARTKTIESRSQVAARHRSEWEEFRRTALAQAISGGIEEAKAAKALADVLKALQDGERSAWSFGDVAVADQALEVRWLD